MKTRAINIVLWLALILAMAASISHLAWTFATVERSGHEWKGWIPALAVDTGLAALAYTIQQRRRAKRSTRALWGGVAGFAVVSALANFYHALSVEGFAFSGSWVAIVKALVLSATLPVAYIFLGEIISGDDAKAADDIDRQAERERTKAERDQRREDAKAEAERLQAERLLLEAKNEAKRLEVQAAQAERDSLEAEAQAEQAKLEAEQSEPAPVASEPAPLVSETPAFPCEGCGQAFGSLNALNAHKRKHAVKVPLNGKVKDHATTTN